jgi:hypothetical protein
MWRISVAVVQRFHADIPSHCPPACTHRGTVLQLTVFWPIQILDNAEKEKERITRESTEAVQQRLQDRARILEQLPGFWGAALRQSLARDYITEDDDKLLDYLVSVCPTCFRENGSPW